MDTTDPGPLEEQIALRVIELVDSLPHLVGVSQPDGRIVWMNQSGCEFLGAGPDDDLTVVDVFGPDVVARYRYDILPVLRRGEPWTGELPVRRPDGTVSTVDAVLIGALDDEGGVRWLATLAVDVTEQRRREAELAHRASHDPLTGLPNRALFEDRLRVAMAVGRRTGAPIAVVALDLDGFKQINDDHGHAAGDLVLQQVTARLRATVRPSDTVARLGGDEFVVVVNPPESTRAAVLVAQRIRQQLSSPVYVLGDGSVRLSASVGLTVAGADEPITAEELVAAADRAMYRAKRAGGDCVRVADWSGHDLDRVEAAGKRIAAALAQGRIDAVLDPVVDVETGAVRSLAVVPRWDDPGLGRMPVEEFMDDAEVTGHGDDVRWRAAERAVGAVSDLGLQVALDLPVSSSQLRLPGFVDRLRVLCRAAAGTARVELDEAALVEIPSQAIEIADRLWADGIPIVLGGHGVGGVPLAILAEVPVAAVKLHPSLVSELPRRGAIALAVQLAMVRGVPCVATGVRDDDERQVLTALGVEAVQGPVTGGPWEPEQAVRATRPRP